MDKRKLLLNQKWRRILFEMVLIFWILSCLYLWVIISGNPNPSDNIDNLVVAYSIKYFSNLSPKINIIVQDSLTRVMPFIWRQNIFVK